MKSDRSDVFKYLLFFVPAVLSISMCSSWMNERDESGVDYKTVCEDGTTSLATGSGACAQHRGVSYYVPEEQQSERMHAMDRTIREIEDQDRQENLP